jgi:DNA modification methylase
MSESFLDGKVTLLRGDCLEVLPTLEENSIDSCVTDPPYFLTSIVKRFGADGAAPCQEGSDGRFKRLSGGFMQKRWDAPDAPAIDPCFANWMAGFIDGEGCFHVHKKNVSGYETYDCQFSINLRADDKPILAEMQRQLGGIGSLADRPKRDKGEAQARYCISSKADCQRLRAVLCAFPLRAKKTRDFEIWCHALDAWVDHKPGSSWDDVAYYRDALMAVRQYGAAFHPNQIYFYRWAREVYRVLKPGAHLIAFGGSRTYHRLAAAIEDAGFEIRDQIQWLYGAGFPKSHSMREIDRPELGTALKPAHEPIVLARKPLSESSIASNVLKHGTGAINIDGCRIATADGYAENRVTQGGDHFSIGSEARTRGTSFNPNTNGRWPANLIHDGSEEVVRGFPETQSGSLNPSHNCRPLNNFEGERATKVLKEYGNDSGSAARFFYTAKADQEDRLGSKHPTVKPLDLIQYLVRLVTPSGGLVLDPFAGTGTLGEAAFREGCRAILVEREPEYQADIVKRMGLCLAGPDQRRAASVKQESIDDLPMFAGRG